MKYIRNNVSVFGGSVFVLLTVVFSVLAGVILRVDPPYWVLFLPFGVIGAIFTMRPTHDGGKFGWEK